MPSSSGWVRFTSDSSAARRRSGDSFGNQVMKREASASTAQTATRAFARRLEVGYGSSVFLAELQRHCEELYGLDPHPMRERVE